MLDATDRSDPKRDHAVTGRPAELRITELRVMPPERYAGMGGAAHAIPLPAGVDERGLAGSAPFTRLFQVVPVAVALTDSAGLVLQANPEFCRLFGYPADEAVGHELSVLVEAEPGHHGPIAARAYSDAAVRIPLRRRDGGRFVTGVRSVAVDMGGETLGRLVVFEPPTEEPTAARPDDTSVSRGVVAEPRDGEGERWSRVRQLAREAMKSDVDTDARLAALARALVPAMGDSCIVYLREGGSRIRRVEIALADVGLEQLLGEQLVRYPPSIERLIPPVARTLLTGEPQLLPEVSIGALKAVPGDREHVSVALVLGLTSLMVAPLRAGGEVWGALSVGTAESGRRFTADDLALLQAVAMEAQAALTETSG
jgi:PAS domain S-box-containing protein